jgi:hypothetical protein
MIGRMTDDPGPNGQWYIVWSSTGEVDPAQPIFASETEAEEYYINVLRSDPRREARFKERP